MDFDEYEYLEKTVESAELVKGSNGATVKSRSAEKRRPGEEGDGGEDGYRSKRHRSGDVERETSERSHSERDHGRERSKDRGDRRLERSHRDRGDRDQERDHRDGERRRGSKDRDRGRDYDKEQEKDADRRGSKDRSQSRSRDIDRRSKDRSQSSSRDIDLHRKDRSQSRSRDIDRHDRESSRNRDLERDHRYTREKREKKEEAAAEPEVDPERDQRTVFAFQISLKADERDVYDFFSRAGKVRDVRLIMDRNTRRSKGVGYIEFYDAMSVPMAIALTGQLLLGQPVMVKPSEAEKNLVQSTTTATAGASNFMGPYSGGARRLYVGNLHYNIAEDQLRQVFEPFGVVELVQLPTEPDTGHCKGYGFVQYLRLEDARAAQLALNGVLELAGRVIKVVPMTDQLSMQDPTVAPGELDDDDGGGLSLTARSRALLMQKLDRSGTVSSIAASTAAQVSPAFNLLSAVPAPTVASIVPGLGLPGMVGLPYPGLGAAALGAAVVEPIGTPTECLLLKNMFDPSTETEPDFDLDIKEEVQTECAKYGVVKHIFVDKNSAGHVYLWFDSLTAAMSAQRSLHGRWFAGKMITTTYMTPQAYEAKFPESR